MSIGVQSYPELYTILLGWDLYDKLWHLLTQTGLAYLPLIGMILKNVAKSYVTEGNQGAGTSLRSMEVSFITTLVLILFAVAPCLPLDAHTVSYTPICHEKEESFFPGSTGTTYDKAFAIPKGDVRVPIWWYAVLSVSEGTTSAANTLVGCVPNLRKMVSEVDMTKISDPALKEQLQDFETMCYAPARMQFFQDGRNNQSSHIQRIQDDVKKFGADDTEWLGSHAFNNVYYQQLKAEKPINGFLYDPNEDINANRLNPPAYGTPTCFTWWNDKQNGLKNKLYQALPKSFFDEFKEFINSNKAQDDVIKKIILNADNGMKGYSNAHNMINDAGYSQIASALGVFYHQLEEYPKIYAAAEAAPIIQALLLLMVYVFLPFALVFSGYRASAFVTGAIIIFSINFWGFIWHLVSWTDKSLMQALYANWFAKQGAGASLTDMIIGTLTILAPLFWFMFMGAMGIAAGHVVSQITMGLNGVGSQAAGSPVAKINQAANTAASVITKL